MQETQNNNGFIALLLWLWQVCQTFDNQITIVIDQFPGKLIILGLGIIFLAVPADITTKPSQGCVNTDSFIVIIH